MVALIYMGLSILFVKNNELFNDHTYKLNNHWIVSDSSDRECTSYQQFQNSNSKKSP